MAEGAVHVDSTHLTLPEVIDPIVALAEQARAERTVSGTDLPASSARAPAHPAAGRLRPVAARLIRRRWPVSVHRADRVPATGGVILAANHVGIVDGPLLATYAPRPVHALTKREMFDGRLGGFLRATGQIPLDRFARRPRRDPLVAARHPRRGSGRHLPRGHPQQRRAATASTTVRPTSRWSPAPRSCRSPSSAPAVARRRARCRRAAAPSTSSSAEPWQHDTAALATHPGTRGRHVGVAPGAHAVRAGQRPLADAPILVRAPTCGTIRGRPRHRARRAFPESCDHA